MTKTNQTDFFDNEIAVIETAQRLCWLNNRLHQSAAIALARTVLTDGTHICNDCLSKRLDEIEKTDPQDFRPKSMVNEKCFDLLCESAEELIASMEFDDFRSELAYEAAITLLWDDVTKLVSIDKVRLREAVERLKARDPYFRCSTNP